MTRLAVALLLSVAPAAFAQAPSNAPANASGICKDGTYSMAASKDGACRGHKGVQTWYKATAAAGTSMPAPKQGSTATVPAPASATTQRSMPAPAPVPSTPAMSAPKTAPAARTMPVPSSAPSQSMPVPSAAGPSSQPSMPAPQPRQGSTKMSPAARAASIQAAPGGGPGLVWVNTASKVYHCSGSDFYGKTKAGAYMSESDARAQGARPDHNKPCS